MNAREKKLAMIVGGMVALFASGIFIQSIFVKPLKELDKQTASLRDNLTQLNNERRAFFSAEDYMKGLTPRMFGRDADTATAQAGKMLTEQIIGLGLQESQFNRQPSQPRRLRGAQEIGWSVQGEGPTDKMLDLLFVLEQAPQIHRLDNLVFSVGDRPGRMKARFRYLSLVIDNAPEGKKVDLQPKYNLDSPQRRFYDCIVQRDLFRPYIQRPADAPAAVADSGEVRPEMLKVVSLSEWSGVSEVAISDMTHSTVAVYKPGDALAGGQIATVDYRAMPLPNKPGLVSYARVIVKIDTNYWAIEQGQTLATKYQLTADQLPNGLR